MRKPTPLVIKWKTLSFVRLTLPFTLGICLAEKFAIPSVSLNYCLLFLFCTIYYFKRSAQPPSKRWISGLFINLFLLLFGCQITYYHNDIINPQHFQKEIQPKNFIIGIVENIPIAKKDKIKITLKTQFIGSAQNDLAIGNGKLLVYLDNYENAPIINYGDQLLIQSKIVPIQKSTNPNAFDYSRYLRLRNIHFQTFTYQKSWKVIAAGKGNAFWQSIYKLRSHFLSVLRKHITTEKELAIASALILGDRNQLTEDLKNAYSESGAIHVLAVSGLHIGIINFFILSLLRLFPFKNRHWKLWKLGLTLGAIWGFALLTGMSVSVQRAAIMFSVLNFGFVIQRDINIYNSLAIAAFFILMLNPYALFDIGFQFSFLAVVGIVFFFPKLKQFWLPKNRLLSGMWRITLVSISAQFALFPLILYYFHEFPTYFWLSSLIVIPLAGLLMKLGISLLVLNSVSVLFAKYIGIIMTEIIEFQNEFISLIQQLPFYIFSGFWLNGLEVVLLYGFILGIALLLLTYKSRWIFGALTCLLLVFCVQLKNKFGQIYQKKIVIYSLSKNSVIDFIDGTKIYSLEKEKLSNNQFKHAIQNNRWAVGTNRIIAIDRLEVVAPNFLKKGSFLKFYDTKLVLLNKPLPKEKRVKKPFDCDYLILQNNPDIEITQLIQYYNFKELIFDKSNAFWQINRWKKACAMEGINCRDISTKGAYVIDLNTNFKEKYNGQTYPKRENTNSIVSTKSNIIHSPSPSLESPPSTDDD